MKIGLIGLGRMGMNMARRWLKSNHQVVVYNRSQEKVRQMTEEGALGADSVESFLSLLGEKKLVWLMLPAGKVTAEYIDLLTTKLSPGDIIIEGGNSHYKEDINNFNKLNKLGIGYIDAGISGGIWGSSIGYCSMIGGEKKDFQLIEPLIKDLAPEKGYLHCGPAGAGHYVKMIHNAIEYAMMQAYGEGFELLKASPYKDYLHMDQVASLWNQGSVIRSWLLELLENSFQESENLEEITGYVEDSGEARWAMIEAIEKGVAVPGIAESLFRRFLSRQQESFSNKVVASLRNQFGGHMLVRKEDKEKFSADNAGAGSISAAKQDDKYKGPRS